MQITVTVPEEFAAQVQAQGISPEAAIEQWIAGQVDGAGASTSRARKLEELEIFFSEMTADSKNVPILPDAALSRESFYQDRG